MLCGKVCHNSWRAAGLAVLALYRAGAVHPHRLRIYHCDDCRAYHVGNSHSDRTRKERSRWPYTMLRANPS